ncbi:hypothetical protein MTBUT4_260055 [Magnetospirillum sp. UT-4]|nr:hypothetical protein MTBUT4_260055 [Magnetospirillum sp. UT-4]
MSGGGFTTEAQRHREGTEEKYISPSLCPLCVSVPLW